MAQPILSEELVERFRRDGYLVVEDVFAPEEVEAFLYRRVYAQGAVVHRQGSFVAAAAVIYL